MKGGDEVSRFFPLFYDAFVLLQYNCGLFKMSLVPNSSCMMFPKLPIALDIVYLFSSFLSLLVDQCFYCCCRVFQLSIIYLSPSPYILWKSFVTTTAETSWKLLTSKFIAFPQFWIENWVQMLWLCWCVYEDIFSYNCLFTAFFISKDSRFFQPNQLLLNFTYWSLIQLLEITISMC